MRSQFVHVKTRREAVKLCPWALYIKKVEDGYACFESFDDYKIFINAT